MHEYFSVEKIIEVNEKTSLYIKPSSWDEKLSVWSSCEITCYLRSEKLPTATATITPGSDTLKVVLSENGHHIAVMSTSQWYEDLDIFEIPTLRRIASFSGMDFIDGASEGIFTDNFFITLPTFSYEGGCGGLRRVHLADGRIEVLLPPDIFEALNVPLNGSVSNPSSPTGVTLSQRFGLIGHSYDQNSGALTMEFVPGVIKALVDPSLETEVPVSYCFLPRPPSEAFFDSDGAQLMIRDDQRMTDQAAALELLRRALGDATAEYRIGQWEAIDALVNRRERLLVVQRTGWGKSSVYFISTRILRDRGRGPTLIVSPLLALMRNQIDAAERLGVRALTVNSTNREDWPQIQRAVRRTTRWMRSSCRPNGWRMKSSSKTFCCRSPSGLAC
jgi:hypothetical protein